VSDRRIGCSEFLSREVFPVDAEIMTDAAEMRHPFLSAALTFMESYKGVYSHGMMVELSRRYPKIDKQLHGLWKGGKISTMDPAKLKTDDIKEYVIFLRTRGLRDTSIAHDICAISNVCKYTGENNCVDMARVHYPLLFMSHRHVRLPVMERPVFDKFFTIADSLTSDAGYMMIRAYAVTALTICAGLRTQEIQHAKMEFLDKDLQFIFLDHVKGKNTYGTARTVPIRPECVPIMRLYLSIRDQNVNSIYIFANRQGKFLSDDKLRQDKDKVCVDLDFHFDFRMCRRTYAQYLVDEGFPIDRVSVVLGHSNTRTTELAYARPRDDRVVRQIVDSWSKTNKIGGKK